MSLVQLDTGNDPWLTEYESCEKLYRELVGSLQSRSAFAPGSDKYNASSASIRLRLKQYNSEVDQLKMALLYNTNSRGLTFEEKERRQRLVEDLESKNVQLSQQLRITPEQRDRRKLFDVPIDSESNSNGSWLDDERRRDRPGRSDQDVSLLGSEFVPSVQTLRREKEDILAEQDRGLDNLSKVISRQKNIAITIGTEVDLHNDLLEDISTRMDTTNSSIQRESAHVRVITDKDNTFGYWLIIILLFLVIVFIAMF